MPGALVISLDFELHWGVRDTKPVAHPYKRNLLGARQAVPRLLETFARRGIHATWAFVGMLGCAGRDEWRARWPDALPTYADGNLSPYHEVVGVDELSDTLHFAPSLLRQIEQTPGQELGSHTFSHYYSLAGGQTAAQFESDLIAARAVDAALGLGPSRSIVLPRNQINASYEGILLEQGFDVVRTNQRSWMYRHGNGPECASHHRLGRLADAHLPVAGHSLVGWDDLWQSSGICNVPASAFLRPVIPGRRIGAALRGRRIAQALRAAAETGQIFHLWWHPHNFGANLTENLVFLEDILRTFAELRETHEMVSASMGEIAATSR